MRPTLPPDSPLTNGQASNYNAAGFEIGLHPQNGCGDYTPTTLDSDYSSQLSSWSQIFTSLLTRQFGEEAFKVEHVAEARP